MDKDVIYTDENLSISNHEILFKGYYFLKFGQKRIKFSDIEKFEEVRLTYFNGLTRHEQVWLKPRWPFDWKTKDRKEVFFIKPRHKFLGVGFSASNPREVALLIHKKLNGTKDA